MIFQPENKKTGPGLLLPLKYLSKRNPESAVAVFPADHFIIEEDRFIEHVKMAFRIIEKNPSLLVLLGMKPNRPEPDYGYILPGEPLCDLGYGNLLNVSGFVEKPGTHAASGLIQKGGLWNTFVMVFQAKKMLSLLSSSMPSLYNSFEQIGEAVRTIHEMDVIEAVYRDIQPIDFSKEILECFANKFGSHLAVLRVEDVFWSDWGTEFRILGDLKKLGYLDRFQEIHQNGTFAWSESNR